MMILNTSRRHPHPPHLHNRYGYAVSQKVEGSALIGFSLLDKVDLDNGPPEGET